MHAVYRGGEPLLLFRPAYPKYVLSMDEVPMGRNGVVHMNLREFLKDPPIARGE